MNTQKTFLLGALFFTLPLTLEALDKNEPAKKTEAKAGININALREAAEKAGLVLGGDDGRTVVEVRDNEITVVHIPDGVTKIEDNAFSRCSSLLSVTIPDTVTSIGDFAFYNCHCLARINLPGSVTSIGKGAFLHCYNLGEITIPASVTKIGTRAFRGIKSVRVSAENPVFSIDNRGVLINKKEKQIHSATRSISGYYTIPAGITSIGEEAFLLCPQLWHVTIPAGVTTIGRGAFYNNCNLFSVTIPESVTTIGEEAFAYSENLKLTIPAGVTNIADNAFTGTKFLKIAAENPVYYVDQHGVLFNKKEKQLVAAPRNIAGHYTVPDGITSIAKQAFMECECLRSITIPEGVTSIGTYAFSACSNLEEIKLPKKMTKIGMNAFSHCGFLTAITLPEGITTIENGVFRGCRSLKSLIIPRGVTSIGNEAFSNCFALSSITIPDTVTSIGDSAFSDCRNLSTITLPDAVTSIGDYTFVRCEKLKEVTIPAGVTKIGIGAFILTKTLKISLGNPVFVMDEHGVVINKQKKRNRFCSKIPCRHLHRSGGNNAHLQRGIFRLQRTYRDHASGLCFEHRGKRVLRLCKT